MLVYFLALRKYFRTFLGSELKFAAAAQYLVLKYFLIIYKQTQKRSSHLSTWKNLENLEKLNRDML